MNLTKYVLTGRYEPRFDYRALFFNGSREYRVPRHSIPPLTIVVKMDLSVAWIKMKTPIG